MARSYNNAYAFIFQRPSHHMLLAHTQYREWVLSPGERLGSHRIWREAACLPPGNNGSFSPNLRALHTKDWMV